MSNRISCLLIAMVLCCAGPAVAAYEFWGITAGAADHEGINCITFDGVAASGVSSVVGGYKYTRTDGEWSGPYAAPAPGEGFSASRRSDAMGLFYHPDAAAAEIIIITTSNQAGAAAPEVGAGARLFGPGDLKIDVDGRTYGVGLRLPGLLWAVDPASSNPEHQIWNADGTVGAMHARDGGTLGTIEMNPIWGRVGHATLAAGSDAAPAFFVSGSGTSVGSAGVCFQDTGLIVGGAQVFAYRVSVPWSAIGVEPGGAFTASFRPDCGNDVLSAEFTAVGASTVPEPSTMLALTSAAAALLLQLRRH